MRTRLAIQLARAAMVGIVLYVAIDVALVFLRPEFSVLHNAESDYGSHGHFAWLMDVDFVLRCLLSACVVLALPGDRRLRPALAFLLTWAVASGLLAFFPDDPVGTRTHGLARVHLVLALIAFPAVVVGTRWTSRVLRRDVRWAPVAGWLTVLSWGALVPLVLLGRAHLRPHSLGGLYEKVFLGVELAWFLVAAWWLATAGVES